MSQKERKQLRALRRSMAAPSEQLVCPLAVTAPQLATLRAIAKTPAGGAFSINHDVLGELILKGLVVIDLSALGEAVVLRSLLHGEVGIK